MWSGPAAATMCSVPPYCGAVELLAAGVLLFDELHAARPATAITAADSITKRLGALVMGTIPCHELGRDRASIRRAPRGNSRTSKGDRSPAPISAVNAFADQPAH